VQTVRLLKLLQVRSVIVISISTDIYPWMLTTLHIHSDNTHPSTATSSYPVALNMLFAPSCPSDPIVCLSPSLSPPRACIQLTTNSSTFLSVYLNLTAPARSPALPIHVPFHAHWGTYLSSCSRIFRNIYIHVPVHAHWGTFTSMFLFMLIEEHIHSRSCSCKLRNISIHVPVHAHWGTYPSMYLFTHI
jgi:hypothetical protein